jgi:hypothetical protein
MIKRIGWIIPVLLLFAFSAKADTVNIYFDGGYSFGDNGVGIPPYTGTLNGQSAQFYCVDFSHDITGGTSWMATVSTIPNSGTGTRLDNVQDYEIIEILLNEELAATTQQAKAEYQWAIWDFSGGGDPYGTDSLLIVDALTQLDKPGFQLPGGWEILTPTGSYGQEFFVQTPEPASLLLLGVGMAMLFVMSRKKVLA